MRIHVHEPVVAISPQGKAVSQLEMYMQTHSRQRRKSPSLVARVVAIRRIGDAFTLVYARAFAWCVEVVRMMTRSR